ncbi:hydrolase 1, exosortase A system-associated [Sphingomonas jatrophae]|uniref:Exosortase A system-associated hydrolase 1 n=1 Tax=Sphingomonas jatrophae TaxID=1166337 RepID=A0A1I6JX24_9SPHN|nr:hydrolase 1, exosortase A system-associated [Sphingomonas jatrophae]SFR83491.1 exosortase A system-associated hydrolase 1 [Sphingomonas jatrophae]
MRRALTVACESATLVASLDEAPGTTGLLIVTGGLQVRSGAHGGQARLAALLAAAGHPVLRYDRRGIGDSDGDDPGWRDQLADIAAAAAALRRAQPQLTRIVGYGLCDAAAALALHGRAAGLEALILANPQVVEPAAGLPPPAAIRSRYRAQLGDVDAWRRLLTGRLDLRRVARGLAAALSRSGALTDQLAAALLAARLPTTVLLAEGDATAIAFAAAARSGRWRDLALDVRVRPSASHGFAGEGDAAWLAEQVAAVLGSRS